MRRKKRSWPGMIALCLTLGLLLTGGKYCADKVRETLEYAEEPVHGTGWSCLTDAQRFERLADALEEQLSQREWYTDGILYAPEEYDIRDRLKELRTMKPEELSGEERLLYDKLLYCLEMWEQGQKLPDYAALLSDLNSPFTQILQLLCAGRFGEAKDVEEYFRRLALMAEMLEHFNSRLEDQRDAGFEYSEQQLQSSLAECRRWMGEDSPLIRQFEDRLQKCDILTPEEKERFLKRNRVLFRENLRTAFRKMEKILKTMEGARTGTVLCELPMGREYFDWMLQCNTGTNRDAEDWAPILEQARQEMGERMRNYESRASGELPENASVAVILQTLYERTGQAFSDLPAITYSLEALPDMEDKLYKAFFIREKEENKIYIDAETEKEDYLALYQTLAHEAFPGHAYSCNVVREMKYPVTDGQLQFKGTCEGWAVYAEELAGSWLTAGQDEYYAEVTGKLYDEIVLCQLDIGVHALGWDMSRVDELIRKAYGVSDRETAEAAIRIVTDYPGVYEPYVIGYLQICEMEKKWCEGRGWSREEFLHSFHQCGQAPFEIIENYLERKEE